MDASHAFFDHTGDFGVDLQGPDLPSVVAEFARAFLSLLTGDAASVRAIEPREVEVDGFDATDALVAFGNELLFLFEAEGFLVARAEVHAVDEQGFDLTLWGEAYDPQRHPIARPIKAITHHLASLQDAQPGAPARARVVFDL